VWDLSCRDWQDRIRERRPLIPSLPLFESEANIAVSFFDALKLPDVPGTPLLRDAAGDWYRDIVRAVFGSLDPETKERQIREAFALVPKGQSKTSYSAGLMVTALLMNFRPRAEMLFVGPTQAIADLAFGQAVGMIEADPQLRKRFVPREHTKEIIDLLFNAKLKVKTFDLTILTGPKPVFVLVDELHLLGKNPHASKVLRQIRGGLEKNPEGFLLIITTQSDEQPAGAFKDELMVARKIRDGAMSGRMLPMLYEFPPDIAKDPVKWQDPANWSMVMPNLGRSMWLPSLTKDWESEREKGEHAIRVWASQHLNIEIGLGIHTNRWAGALDWEMAAEGGLTLETLIERSEVITGGVDGGGRDDLLSLVFIGRDKVTQQWLQWSRSWVDQIALERRKEVAARLEGFRDDGDLVIVDVVGDDIEDLADTVAQVEESGKLAGIGFDPAGIGMIIDALSVRGISGTDRIIGVSQGWTISNAIKTVERKLADGTLVHCGQEIMAWAVGNARVEPKGNAITITKQVSGSGKIDPLAATFNAATLMARNPAPIGGPSVYETRGILEIEI
jgi:phage terminase large subunit-like protein